MWSSNLASSLLVIYPPPLLLLLPSSPSPSSLSSSSPSPSPSSLSSSSPSSSLISPQVERQLQSGRLSEEQHSTLVKQLDQLYALQRKKENGRGESRGSSPSGPATRGQSPPLTSDKGRTDHPLSDSVQSCHDNHLPSVSVPGTRPPPSVLDTDFRPPSPPPHAPVPHPHPPPDPHIDRHPHTRSHDRYPPRQFPDYHSGPRGPRPYRGRGPRGRHHFDRHPRPPGRPNSEWYPRGPPERWRDHNREESPPTSKIPLPQTQSESNILRINCEDHFMYERVYTLVLQAASGVIQTHNTLLS